MIVEYTIESINEYYTKNDILNDIHRTNYMKIGQEPVLVPEFERDILSYAM